MRALLLTLLLALVGPAPASASWRFDGHGWGHGVGLAQYGALGYARDEHRSGSWILAHYYAGTTIATRPASRIRVRLAQASSQRVTLATRARGADGRLVALAASHRYRFTPLEGGDLLRVYDLSAGRAVAHLHAPVRITGATPVRLRGTAENGVTDGRYRGALVVRRDGDLVTAVDDADLEQYLWGVVASEMSASWPGAALRAQAVAARSYALTSLRPAEPFDVYADARSQVYRGVAGEAPPATAAVAATSRQALMSGGAVAKALFSSSSGGRTAANEEIWPGTVPLPYLRGVDDPYDRLSPHHDWSVTLGDAELMRRLGATALGELVSLAVVATTPSGRAARLRVTGTLGAADVAAGTARSLLGLRSTWFAIARA